MKNQKAQQTLDWLSLTVFVSALGYFVDIYDILLFGIVRGPSLTDIGVPADQILAVSLRLANIQSFGMLLGGFLWGTLGDKRGRVSMLFGSILLYSIANVANGFIVDVNQYALCRFVAGFGLAAELGAAITLINESMGRERRGIGTMVVASFGLLGAVGAAVVSQLVTWRVSYLIGGGLGLVLLALRYKIYEPAMFQAVKERAVSRGNFFKLFRSRAATKKYVLCTLAGLPLPFVSMMVVTFIPEIAKDLGIAEAANVGLALIALHLGASLGDIVSGAVSQKLRNRRKVVLGFFAVMAGFMSLLAFSPVRSLPFVYMTMAMIGFGGGYVAVYLSMSAEQFGTDLRATATTSIPTFFRSGILIYSPIFQFLVPLVGYSYAAYALGLAVMACAALGVLGLRETFAIDMDFLEISPSPAVDHSSSGPSARSA